MIEYEPGIRYSPKIISDPSPWGDIPTIIHGLILRFNLKTDIALDLGVWLGYSTSAFANYFKRVIGVDTFTDDFTENNDQRPCYFFKVVKMLWEYPNIYLIRSKYQDFIKEPPVDRFDLIHCDMLHYYQDTYDAGKWSMEHSDCVIFHDTISFPEVYKACEKLAEEFNYEFYNYPDSNGLGILVKK